MAKETQHPPVEIDSTSDAAPFYPILSVEEVGEPLKDLRIEVPDLVDQLGDDDVVIHVVRPDIIAPRSTPSLFYEIKRLSHSDTLANVGDRGPVVASLATALNQGSEALRKFEVPHGRDALTVALDLHKRFPKLLKSTLLYLAGHQGMVEEEYVSGVPFRQEEIGRILLLNRHIDDPVGRKFSDKLGWGWPFYGSIDATPTFITGIATYVNAHDPALLTEQYVGRDGDISTIGDSLARSVNWLINKLHENPEGLLEYRNKAPSGGMMNQAWKDSAFAYVHSDASLANYKEGIASVEVQALAYDALRDAADIFRHHFDDELQASKLEHEAERLRQQVLKAFWVEDGDGGYFALATDRAANGTIRQLQVKTSNMGHLLNSRILDGDDPNIVMMRDAIVAELFSPALLCWSGLRTMANTEKAFREGGYHTGTSWLKDTQFISDGLERHGNNGLAWELRKRIWRTMMVTNKCPEFVRGGNAEGVEMNKREVYVWNTTHKILHLFEQPDQEIQAWTVSAILANKYRYAHLVKGNPALLRAVDPTKQKLEDRILSSLTS